MSIVLAFIKEVISTGMMIWVASGGLRGAKREQKTFETWRGPAWCEHQLARVW